eukprot:5288974-Ditylum_brightwellii.AAC.1
MDKTYDELDDDFKSYSSFTAVNSQISLLPGTKRNVKAFIQWTRDRYRLGENPVVIPYLVADAAAQIRRYKHHNAFIIKSKTLAETATPEQFTEKKKWLD